MGRPKAELRQVGGAIFEIIKALSQSVEDLGGSDDDLRRILNDELLLKQIAWKVIDESGARYPITVNYRQSLNEVGIMDPLSSRDSLLDEGLFWHFPGMWTEWTMLDGTQFSCPAAKASVECRLFRPWLSAEELKNPDAAISTKRVLAQMKRQDLRPANMAELFVFADKYPDVAKVIKLRIVALGANREGMVPMLRAEDNKTCLRMLSRRSFWLHETRFLAVPLDQS